MDQFIFILTRPDNIPITMLLILVLVCLYTALKQAFKHDQHHEQDGTDPEEE